MSIKSNPTSLLNNCIESAINLTKGESLLRRNAFLLFKADGLNQLGYTINECMREVISKSKGSRSSVNRQMLAAYMDYILELPPGKVKEYTLRVLRTKVPKLYHAEVIQLAHEKKKSYASITSKDIKSCAKELGCLKENSSSEETKLDEAEATDSGKSEKSAKHIVETENGNFQDNSSNLNPILQELTVRKSDISWVKKLLERSYSNPDLVQNLEMLSLTERRELLNKLKKP